MGTPRPAPATPAVTAPAVTPDRRDPPWWAWVLATLALYGIALAGFSVTASGAVVASWWPAAGASLLFTLLMPGRSLPIVLGIVLAITLAANLTIGRPPAMALCLAIANAMEIGVVALILGIHRRRFRLTSVRAAGRFILAAVVGAVTLGNLAGLVAWVMTDADFVTSATTAAASHIASILLIAPFGALPPRLSERISPLEATAQSLLLAAAVAIAFQPLAALPISFIVFAFIAWGALRQPVAVAYLQALIVAVGAFLFERIRPDSFTGYTLDPAIATLVTVVFMSTVAIFTLLLVSARYEALTAMSARLSLARAQVDAERERTAALTERLELKRQRTDFIATTSHELRTPVTSISGYAELLADSDALPPRERGWAEAIDRNALRLSALVEDLLVAGRGGAGAGGAETPASNAAGTRVDDATTAGVTPAIAADAPPSPSGEGMRRASGDDTEELGAAALVADVIATHLPAADARAIDMQADIAELALHGDPDGIRRALSNLVSNAIKFAPRGGSVGIRVELAGGHALITVTDDGPGMSAETLAHAFERFYRGPDAERLSTPGTGLGLAIVRDLVERNGGSVHLENASGGGLRAAFTVPLA